MLCLRVITFQFHLIMLSVFDSLRSQSLPVVRAMFDSEAKEASGKCELDELFEKVDVWKKQPVNIAVINFFSDKIIIC